MVLRCDKSGKSLDVVFMYVGSQSMPPRRATFGDIRSAMQKLISMISTRVEE